MSMRWDALLAGAAARELHRVLEGARTRALLLDSTTRRVLLFLRTRTLALELHPLRGWLSLLPSAEPPAEARSFSHDVREVHAPPDESVLVFGLGRGRGRGEAPDLVVELIGNRWNAVVVGGKSRTIRHVLLSREDRSRPLTVGSPYRPPPPTERAGADRALDASAWERILEDPGVDPSERRSRILRRIAWTSSLNVDVLVGPDGWETWHRMTDPGTWDGFLLQTRRGAQPYPVALAADGGALTEAESFPSLVEAFHAARERDPEAEPTADLLLPPKLLARAEDRLDRARGRVAGLKRELDRPGDPDADRAVGDLLLARFNQVPHGEESVVLVDFDGGEVRVELDPGLSPEENAAHYYERAARLERARDTLPGKISEAETQVRRWRKLIEDVREGRLPPDALSRALGPEQDTREGAPAKQRASLPYRRYLSSGGLEIRVGRGASQNDDLTFHHSAPMDVWLHVRQSPGAHVILRWSSEERPPRRDLAEAASLAALHSPARHSGSVPVAWTRRKYVRKPRKASPGTVLPERTETVFVTPDSALLERLLMDDRR